MGSLPTNVGSIPADAKINYKLYNLYKVDGRVA